MPGPPARSRTRARAGHAWRPGAELTEGGKGPPRRVRSTAVAKPFLSIRLSALLARNLGPLLAGLGQADGDRLLGVRDFLLRLAARERALLHLMHRLFDLGLGLL